MILASIPSPSQGVWHLGPVPIRAYALCIIVGVIAAAILGNRAWVKRGGRHGTVYDITIWAVPFGLVGSRIYHVITDWQLYFGDGANPWRAFYVWEGGLGIWGGVAFGVLGGWIGCRLKGISLLAMADTVAPYIVLAQGIGRLGNWFNQELFGQPTTLPWGLEITPALRPEGFENVATFHPTFLYELLWDIAVCLVLIWAIRRFRLGYGRGFALYVALYTFGRGWIESLRIDEVRNPILGLRLNIWTSAILFLAAIVYIVVSARLRPGVETDVEAPEPGSEQQAEGGSEPSESAEGVDEAKDSEAGESAELEDGKEAKATGEALASGDASDAAGDQAGDKAGEKVNVEAKSEKAD